MKIEERSYSSKLIRPKPVVYLDPEGSVLVVATAWGQPEHAQRIVEEIAKYVSAAKADVEVTSPFEFLSCLPDEVNCLRTAALIANEALYRGENRSEYYSGVELLVIYKKHTQVAWVQVGAPALLLKRKDLPLQPISAPIDLSTEMGEVGEKCSPLPSQLLGLEPTCDIKAGHFFTKADDQIILLACSHLANSLWSPGISRANLSEITQLMVQENPDLPFWLGIVDVHTD